MRHRDPRTGWLTNAEAVKGSRLCSLREHFYMIPLQPSWALGVNPASLNDTKPTRHMSTRVQIAAIVEGMEVQSDELHSFLHRSSGRVVTVSDEALAAAENDDTDWVTPEELAEARQIVSAQKDYLALPDRFEIDEYHIMERFAHSLGTAEREAALRALRGRGAFRYFKDTMHQLGLAKSWYAFRDESYQEVARAWCGAQGVPHDSSPPDA